MYDIGMHTQANYPIVDLHCDTLTFGADSPGGKDRLAKSRGHLDIPRMQAGGALLQCFAVFAPAEPLRPDTLLGKDPLTIFEVCRSWYEGELLEKFGIQVYPITLKELEMRTLQIEADSGDPLENAIKEIEEKIDRRE